MGVATDLGMRLQPRLLLLVGLHCSSSSARVHACDIGAHGGTDGAAHTAANGCAYSCTYCGADGGAHCSTDAGADLVAYRSAIVEAHC